MKVLVSGLINIENNVCVHRFPVEYTPIEYAFNQVQTGISGVAYNVVKGMNALGDKVFPAAIVGKDLTGQMIKNELKANKIDTQCVFQTMENTCTSTVLYDDEGKRKVYCDLKNIQDLVIPFDSVKEKVEEADGLVICNINFNDELIHRTKETGKPVFTDVHVLSDIHDQYNSRFLKNADIVFLSDEGICGKHEDFLLSIWNEYQNKYIVLGQGKAGAMILDGSAKKIFCVASVNTRPVVNTVGAGDALFSCFVHYYLKSLKKSPLKTDVVECLKKAVTFASWKIGQSGGACGFCNERELEKLCDDIDYSVIEIKSF